MFAVPPPGIVIVATPDPPSAAVTPAPTKFKLLCGVFGILDPSSSTVIVVPDPAGPCGPAAPAAPFAQTV